MNGKIKNKQLFVIMAGLLLVAIILAFLLDPGIFGALTQPPGEYAIVISEICAKNEAVIADNSGVYRDYIELYNSGEALSLKGFRLTDGTTLSQPLGDIYLGAGEYRVIFLGKDLTGFALSASGGDTIQLQDPAGRIVAQTKVSAMYADQVMVYKNGVYVTSQDATPGFSNDEAGRKAFLQGQPAADPKIVISEVLIGNVSAMPDENGVYTDIVELHNISDVPVQLGTYTLSDSLEHRFRFRLPDMTVPAGGYVVIYCDGGSYVSQDSVIHANFGLSQAETVCLTDGQGDFLTISAAWVGENLSQCRNADGTYETMAASIGFANTQTGIADAARSRINTDAPLVISEVLLSNAGVPYEGRFPDVIEIVNRADQPVSTKGWFLSDGADPYTYPLPDVILQPGEVLAVDCTMGTTGFGLSVGETACLTGPDYLHAPLVSCVEPPAGTSISLQPGAELAYDFSAPTPGYENTDSGIAAYAAGILPEGLRISEVMTDNTIYLRGPYGAACDWVELYNGGDAPVELSDFCLTDDPKQLSLCPLPQKTLAPGQYCLVLLTRSPEDARKGYPVADMALSAGGDTIYLVRAGSVHDYAVIPELSRNTSYGRAKGDAGWSVLSSVTAETANSGPALVSRMPEALTAQGTYDNVEYLDVVLSSFGDIYYTTDCTAPSRSSKRYTGPIRLTETTVLRVACYESGKSRSQILDLSYIINENDNLSVVSLVAHPDDLFGWSYGIYTWGPGDNGDYGDMPYKEANFWKDWEKKATVTLIETDGSVGFSEPCGLKIFGGFSRVNNKKSLSCAFRGKYGASELAYPLFGEEGLLTYESFVLRAGGQDAYSARMRDEVLTSLASEYLNIPVQKFRPVVLYINGQYWGIYYIREKLNEQYVAGNFNVEPTEVSIGEWTGDYCPDYQLLRRWLWSHDLTVQENYDQVCQMVNLQNYMDYMIAQMWIGNSDNGNVKFFKTAEHPWHWILFDTDQAFRDPLYDAVAEHLKPRSLYAMDTTSKNLMLALLPRQDFKDMLLRRMAWQINEVWTEEHVIGRIDEIAAMIGPDVAKDCQRWKVSYDYWENSVEHLREYARVRTDYFVNFVQKFFYLTDAQMRDYGFPT